LPHNKKMDLPVNPAGDAALEQWLRDEVIDGHREYLADPSQAVAAEARIKARRATR
jgi:antitoxin ParD1/3/4